MTKIVRWTLISVLLGWFSLPMLALAENNPQSPAPTEAEGTVKNPSESSPSTDADSSDEETQDEEEIEGSEESLEDGEDETTGESETSPVEDSKNLIGFTLQHRVNEEIPLAKTQVIPDPVILLQTFKDELTVQIKKREATALKIVTNVEALFADEITAVLGQLPVLTVQTQVDAEGSGKGDVSLPAFKREIPSEQLSLDWKGLSGQMSFTKEFKKLATTLNVSGLSLTEKSGFSLNLDKSQFSGEFSADLMPLSMTLIIPHFRIGDNEMHFGVRDINFNAVKDNNSTNIELSKVKLNVAQGIFGTNGSEATLNEFKLEGEGKVQQDMVLYILQSSIGKLVLPKDFFGELVELNYVGNMELRRVDLAVVAEMQKTARELRKQRQKGTISEDMVNFAMLGKLMEMMPKLLERLPELAFTQLALKTPEGELQGKLTISINGEKPIYFEEITGLIAALVAQAEFTINKGLLEKMMVKALHTRMIQKYPPEKQLSETELADLEKQAREESKKRIQGYISQKFLIDSGNETYRLIAQLQDGILKVNGQETPLPF